MEVVNLCTVNKCQPVWSDSQAYQTRQANSGQNSGLQLTFAALGDRMQFRGQTAAQSAYQFVAVVCSDLIAAGPVDCPP